MCELRLQQVCLVHRQEVTGLHRGVSLVKQEKRCVPIIFAHIVTIDMGTFREDVAASRYSLQMHKQGICI